MWTKSTTQMINSFILYTQFFTRIPINKAVDFSYLHKGIAFITLFGLLLGLIPASVFALASLILPINIAWLLVFVTDILLTSGFHLDALADTADGLFSSRKKDRMLEIMKDSRVGSNGVIALILYFLLMYAGVVHLPLNWFLQVVLVATLSMVGKAGLALQVVNMVYARTQTGLGNGFCQAKTVHIALSQILPLSISCLFFGLHGLLSMCLVYVTAYSYRQFVYKKIQGHTGDTIGAYVNIAQVVYLLGMLITW